MNQIQPIQLNEQRVLTTNQLAEDYGTDPNTLQVNFSRNKERFQSGKHFLVLQGEDLKAFKNDLTNCNVAPTVNKLYLWTEKGAWLHAKSLNTDRAWNAYEKLIDEYYTIKENVVPLSKDQALVTVLRTTADLVEDTQAIKEEQHEIRKLVSQIDNKVEEQITLDHGEQRRVQKGVARRVYEFTEDKNEAARLFKEIYREIKDRFGVASYKDIKRKELLAAIGYIENWLPRKVS